MRHGCRDSGSLWTKHNLDEHIRTSSLGRFCWSGLGFRSASTSPPVWSRTASPSESTPQSKKYTRALKLYGGTTNALLVELNDWFRGLWHGKPLAVTVAVISLGIALVYLFFATRGPLTEQNEDPTNPSGNPHSG